jgi:hypothetical protein
MGESFFGFLQNTNMVKPCCVRTTSVVSSAGLAFIMLFAHIQVFSPAEKFENPMIINMIFQQIVVDVLNEDCIRIGKSERQKLAALLGQSINATRLCIRLI